MKRVSKKFLLYKSWVFCLAIFVVCTCGKAQERIIELKPGITALYINDGYSNFSIGPSLCLGTNKKNDKHTDFFQLAGMYIGRLEKTDLKNGVSVLADYSFVSPKGLGFSAALQYSWLSNQNYFTPSLGLNYIGFVSISYGYNLTANNHEPKSKHLVTLRITASKIYALAFRMI